MSQNFDTLIENSNINEYNTTPNLSLQTDKMGNILDHLNIFVESLSNINLCETFDITTKENAVISSQKINILKSQVDEKIRILAGLKKTLLMTS